MTKKLLAVLLLCLSATLAHAGLKLEAQVVPLVGFGHTYDGTHADNLDTTSVLHVGGGLTLLKLDKGANIGLLGASAMFDISNFDRHTVELREANRKDYGDPLSAGAYSNLVFMFTPIRLGPFAYSIGLDNNVTSLGVSRGRLKMVSADVLWFIRYAKHIQEK